MEDVEVVGSVCDFPGFVAHELDVFFDVDDVLDVLLGRVGVVEAQVALALTHLRLHEVEPHGFAVTDVQVTVGLGRKSRQDHVAELVYSVLQQLFRVH